MMMGKEDKEGTIYNKVFSIFVTNNWPDRRKRERHIFLCMSFRRQYWLAIWLLPFILGGNLVAMIHNAHVYIKHPYSNLRHYIPLVKQPQSHNVPFYYMYDHMYLKTAHIFGHSWQWNPCHNASYIAKLEKCELFWNFAILRNDSAYLL